MSCVGKENSDAMVLDQRAELVVASVMTVNMTRFERRADPNVDMSKHWKQDSVWRSTTLDRKQSLLTETSAQVETMLKNPDGTDADENGYNNQSMADLSTLGMHDPADLSNLEHPTAMRYNAFASSTEVEGSRQASLPKLDDTFSFDMIALGLEEPLPTSDITDELYVNHHYSNSNPVSDLETEIRFISIGLIKAYQ